MKEEKTMNLMEGLLSEMNRVREVIKQYEDPIMKGAGWFGAAMLKMDIKNAEQAITEGDVVKMLVAYKTLKEIES